MRLLDLRPGQATVTQARGGPLTSLSLSSGSECRQRAELLQIDLIPGKSVCIGVRG